MNRAIIPEVLNRELDTHRIQQPNSVNINLTQKIDKRNYEINHSSYTQNNTTNINNIKRGGFFRFIYDIISLPIVIPYKLIKFVWIKSDMTNKIKLERVQSKKDKWIRKYVHKTHDIYDTEEIF